MRSTSKKLSVTLMAFGIAIAMRTTMVGQAGPAPQEPRPSPAIDLSGYWSPAVNEDGLERGAGSELGDYAGFAVNEAGRLWALSYDPSRLTLKHHQCDGYVAPYQMRAIGNFRIWEDRDPHTVQLIAIHIWAQTTEGHRTIWMDGRPHPPAWAPHTYQGFSTGRFVGDALMVNTDHLKQGWLRRNGLPESDQATMVEFIVRHGDHLVDTTVVNDPVFLTEPEVRSNDFFRQPADHGAWLYACDDGEQIIGMIVNLNNDTVKVNTDPTDPNQQVSVDRKQVTKIEPSKVSLMPPALLNILTKEEVLDLLAYVLSAGDPKNPAFAPR